MVLERMKGTLRVTYNNVVFVFNKDNRELCDNWNCTHKVLYISKYVLYISKYVSAHSVRA